MIDFKLHSGDLANFPKLEWRNFHFSFNPAFSSVYARLDDSEFGLIEVNGDVKGYIPVLLKKSKLINTLKFMFNPVNLVGELFSPQEEEQILEAFIHHLKKDNEIDRILQPLNWMLFQASPKESVSVPFGSYVLNLTDEDTVWKGLHTKHRNVIRNAWKKEAVIKSGADQLTAFYELYSGTMERNNMHCEPKWYFEELLKTNGDNIHCSVVYFNEQAQGALFVPFTKQGAYYVYGASAPRIELTGAVNALHYDLIQNMVKANVEIYDFVGARLSDVSGSRLEGIQKFKKRFGGNLREGYLWKMDLNSTKCKLYDIALSTKLKLKRIKLKGDIIDQELPKFQ